MQHKQLHHRPLTPSEVAEVYATEMQEAFPADELKPLALLLELKAQGVYDCYGLFTAEETLLGYAFLGLAEDAPGYVLLDYLAICAPYRSGGYGTEMLHMLREVYEGFQTIVVELEAPLPHLPEATLSVRHRRQAFYENAGYRELGVWSRGFGVTFTLYAYFYGEADTAGAVDAYAKIYKRQLGAEKYERYIQVPVEGA